MFPDLFLNVFDDFPIWVVYDLLDRSVPLQYEYLLCAGRINWCKVHLLDLMVKVAEYTQVHWLERRWVPLEVRCVRVGGHVVNPSPPRLGEVKEGQDGAWVHQGEEAIVETEGVEELD